MREEGRRFGKRRPFLALVVVLFSERIIPRSSNMGTVYHNRGMGAVENLRCLRWQIVHSRRVNSFGIIIQVMTES